MSLTPEEVAARGESIYEQGIRSKVEDANLGQYLVLDIISGNYEIDDDDLAATQRLLSQYPDAVIYGLRIGHPAAYRLGGFSKART